jgi:branched-chain amino acid transport system substrate-binding protein
MQSMTSWITRAFGLALLGLAPAFAQAPIVVGAVVSLSGAHAELATGYARGLLLWESEINTSGGLLGRPVELRLLDDGSSAAQAGRLYAQLIREGADLLVGPYGSAATLLAAAEAERAQRVLVNGAGPAGAVHQRKPRYVFQSAVPYAAYGAGVVHLTKQAELERVLIFARDDPASIEMAEGAHAAALREGLSSPGIELYGSGTADFTAQVEKARAARVDAWIAFGGVKDAADMVKTLRRLDYAPRLFFARGAAEPGFIALVGQDGEFGLGAIEYDPGLSTPSNAGFVKAFVARWSAAPGKAAAAGYAAVTVLGEALRRAGTLDQEKLRETLARLETATLRGPYKVDPATGAQTGAKAAVVQILNGRREVVWPKPLETAQALLPYPQWGERRLIE